MIDLRGRVLPLVDLRLLLGLPLAVLGVSLVTWGIATLGVRNTSALPNGFVSSGPYAFTRNPQYVGDITLFLGVSIVANSELVLITHLLTSLVFVVAPLAEEPWLEEQYGEPYREYRARVPRFL
jgi:protein-S-isoprenylcysteine O-methyltransferase Ste14